MNIIIPAGFAENIGKKNNPSTVDGASVVAVTIPEDVAFTTVGIYNYTEKTVIDFNGASYDKSFEPVTSVVLTPGVHLVRKRPHQFIHTPAADKAFAVAVLTS